MILSQLFRFCRNSLFQFLNNGFPQKSFPQSHILSLVLLSFFSLNLAISLSMRLLKNGSYRGFGDFLILIFSETIVVAPLIIFLKSFISFKVILDIVLLTSSFPVSVEMHPQIALMELDHFLGFLVILLAILLYHFQSDSQLHLFYSSFGHSNRFQNTPNLARQVLLLQLKQSTVIRLLMHSLYTTNIWSILYLQMA